MFDAVFLGAAMQIPSLLQIEAECHHGRWPSASDRSATTPSATRWNDNLPNPCSRSVVKLHAALNATAFYAPIGPEAGGGSGGWH